MSSDAYRGRLGVLPWTEARGGDNRFPIVEDCLRKLSGFCVARGHKFQRVGESFREANLGSREGAPIPA